MTQNAVLRRLSAVLAADVAGYSRLMAEDEVGTLDRFRRIRAEVIDPAIAQFQGRLVGTAGDSLLVEFTNARAAVQCAVSCQRALREAAAGEPEQSRIRFRMGINLGDVIAADDTIHGDGVNVAARLEKLAEPGGLCISKNVFDLIDGKVDLAFTDLGEHQVKNILKPVRVFRAEMGEPPRPVSVEWRKSSDPVRVSIAVLPFDNMSGDPEQTYFSDGITDDIITELSKFRELLVIARNSSFQFRGKAADIAEVGRKLGAQLLVEGSVRKIGNRIRVTVQLVEAANAAHLWAERYDRDLTDVFEIQDDITRTVVARVAGRARSVGAVRARSRPTESLTAYDWFLQARDYFGSDMTAHLAQPMLRKAIALDPNFADAHAMMSVLYTVRYLHDDDRRHLDEAMRAGRKALEINAEEPRANHALGFALTHLHRMDEAGHYLRLAIALNPNETFFRGDYANWLNYLGDVEAGLREIDEALLRDPYANDWFWDVRGSIEVMGGRFADALKSYQHMKTLAPWSRCHQVLCYSELGKFAEARACLEYIDRNWVVKPEDYVVDRFFLNLAQAERMLEALRRVRASM